MSSSLLEPPAPEVRESSRRARLFLYASGGLLVALGFALDLVPSLAAATNPQAGRASALIGALLLAAGRFGARRFCRQVSAATDRAS